MVDAEKLAKKCLTTLKLAYTMEKCRTCETMKKVVERCESILREQEDVPEKYFEDLERLKVRGETHPPLECTPCPPADALMSLVYSISAAELKAAKDAMRKKRR